MCPNTEEEADWHDTVATSDVSALVLACPVFSGKVGSVGTSEAINSPGVRDVVIPDEIPAVAADHIPAGKRKPLPCRQLQSRRDETSAAGLPGDGGWMKEHAETWSRKIRLGGRYSAADKQGALTKSTFLDQSVHEVTGQLRFQPERDSRSCPEERQTSRGSMSDWLYLIGSFCFVAGTLLNMVQR
jgi:hypothetical protein